ncbi:MAG: hypothetical protein Q3971_02135 [Moraxella sp.]|nr:hypothetical protein [Moraxella sp.]
MNLLSQLNSLLSSEVISVATIVGNKDNDVWVGQTVGGGLVLLISKDSYATGTKVYYNTLDNRIIGNAPNVEYRLYGV